MHEAQITSTTHLSGVVNADTFDFSENVFDFTTFIVTYYTLAYNCVDILVFYSKYRLYNTRLMQMKHIDV